MSPLASARALIPALLQVKRRFREFEGLHEQLRARCPGADLPPLPGKKLFSRMDRCPRISPVFLASDARSAAM